MMFKKPLSPLMGFLLVLQVCFSGCSKKETDFNVVELTLDRSSVALMPGKQISLNITNGNGGYTAVSSNDQVAKATIEGNTITITATTQQSRANAIVVITDKMFKRKSIDVSIAKVLDLSLDPAEATLEVGVPGKEELTIQVTGNFGYHISLLDNASDLISVNQNKLESHGQFTVKALAAGTAKVKLTDAEGKEIVGTFTITQPQMLELSKNTLELTAVQGSAEILINSGNGDYRTTIDNPLIAKAWVKGNTVTVKGKINGSTTLTVEDKKGQKAKVVVNINGPAYAMNFSDQYFGFANFRDIAVVHPFVKSCKQVTFELTCKIDGYRGLQTFMGLEGNLIIRGKNDDYRETHPIQIAGLGDKIMLESKSSFALNRWMNIALVVDCEQSTSREKYKLYINGIQDELIVVREDETHSAVNLASSSDGDRFEIGRAFGQDFRAMRGTVSEARVWNVARTAQQIKDNQCALSPAVQNGLLARWNFSAGAETGYIQDSNGGQYETNLILASAKKDNDYTQIKVPASVFVDKGCPE